MVRSHVVILQDSSGIPEKDAPAGAAAPASMGKAWVVQSRIECRERHRHTEGGDGQPEAVREFGKGGRDDAPALGESGRAAQGAGDAARRCLRTLTACLLLALIAVPDGLAGEWETCAKATTTSSGLLPSGSPNSRQGSAGFRRIRRRGQDHEGSDRRNRGFPERGGKTISLADTTERASGDARALIDVYREHGDYLDIVMSEWGTEGVERRKLRESIAALQKSLGHANADLRRRSRLPRRRPCAYRSRACSRRSPGSRLRQKSERDGRTSGSRERERQQKEREAAERERGVR